MGGLCCELFVIVSALLASCLAAPYTGCSDGLSAHPTDCHKFIECSNGYAYEFSCPADLVWNQITEQCDYPDTSNSCPPLSHNRLEQASTPGTPKAPSKSTKVFTRAGTWTDQPTVAATTWPLNPSGATWTHELQGTDTSTHEPQRTDTSTRHEPQGTDTWTHESQRTDTSTHGPQGTYTSTHEPQQSDTWTDEPQRTETWTHEPQQSDTWTHEPQSTDTWTNEQQSSDTWVNEPHSTTTWPLNPSDTTTWPLNPSDTTARGPPKTSTWNWDISTTSAPSTTTTKCPAGWYKPDDLDVCYGFFSAMETWDRAERVCRGYGATLAMPREPQEMEAVLDARNRQKVKTWIGLSDRTKEGEMTWNDGSPLGSWTYWDTDEPDNWSQWGVGSLWGQDCVVIKDTDKWNDRNCYEKYSFVCQYTENSPTLTRTTPRPTTTTSPTIKTSAPSTTTTTSPSIKTSAPSTTTTTIPYTGCGGILTGTSGTFTSPGYPRDYANDLYCTWEIHVPSGKAVTLTFDTLYLEDIYDCLIVNNRQYSPQRGNLACPMENLFNIVTSRFLGLLTGYIINRPTVTSSGNVMFITLLTDGSVTRTGFLARWTAVNRPNNRRRTQRLRTYSRPR